LRNISNCWMLAGAPTPHAASDLWVGKTRRCGTIPDSMGRFEYYENKLSADKLRQVYEIAPPRIRQYLEAELDHVLERIKPGGRVLELGCGYGRILAAISRNAGLVMGIDTSYPSLKMGAADLAGIGNCLVACMDASQLALDARTFDCVVCIQNGISAFHVDRMRLIRESIRVARPGGIIMFSTYAAGFWDDRLEWFRLQAEAGLLGDLDLEASGDGTIVCKDGFTATTVSPAEFMDLTARLDAETTITEVDGSSLFCEIIPGGTGGFA
jgi:SAM-dependent methyltransferase